LADFGINQDGTMNITYCRHCYQKGVFVAHGITLEQIIEKNIATPKKGHISRKNQELDT